MAENLTVSVLRPDDLLVLKFEFVNLVRKEIVDPQLGPLSALARQLFLQASGMGLGRADDSQVVQVYRGG